MIHMLGRPSKKRKFVINQTSFTSEHIRTELTQRLSSVDFRIENLTDRSPDKNKLPRVLGQDETSYVQILSTSSGSVYMDESPQKAPEQALREVRFKSIPPIAELRTEDPAYFETPRTQTFDFSITRKDVEARMNKKRTKTQRQVVGCTANEIFVAYNTIFEEQMNSFRNAPFHHAHRRGWSLGGAQAKENMDPGTAGSNYSTLFLIESPLKNLLREDFTEMTDNMHVYGTVKYHPKVNLPMEITYQLRWGRSRTYTTSVYPLNHRIPTVSENKVAKAVIKAVRSPEPVHASSALTCHSMFAVTGSEEKENCSKKLFPDDIDAPVILSLGSLHSTPWFL